eukprot:gene3880-2752_t
MGQSQCSPVTSPVGRGPNALPSPTGRTPHPFVFPSPVAASPVVSSVRDFSCVSSEETDEQTRAAREFAAIGPPPIRRIQDWLAHLPQGPLRPVPEPEIFSDGEKEWRAYLEVDASPDEWSLHAELERKRARVGGHFVSAIGLDSPRGSVVNLRQQRKAKIIPILALTLACRNNKHYQHNETTTMKRIISPKSRRSRTTLPRSPHHTIRWCSLLSFLCFSFLLLSSLSDAVSFIKYDIHHPLDYEPIVSFLHTVEATCVVESKCGRWLLAPSTGTMRRGLSSSVTGSAAGVDEMGSSADELLATMCLRREYLIVRSATARTIPAGVLLLPPYHYSAAATSPSLRGGPGDPTEEYGRSSPHEWCSREASMAPQGGASEGKGAGAPSASPAQPSISQEPSASVSLGETTQQGASDSLHPLDGSTTKPPIPGPSPSRGGDGALALSACPPWMGLVVVTDPTSPWCGGCFSFSVTFPSRYPFDCPQIELPGSWTSHPLLVPVGGGGTVRPHDAEMSAPHAGDEANGSSPAPRRPPAAAAKANSGGQFTMSGSRHIWRIPFDRVYTATDPLRVSVMARLLQHVYAVFSPQQWTPEFLQLAGAADTTREVLLGQVDRAEAQEDVRNYSITHDILLGKPYVEYLAADVLKELLEIGVTSKGDSGTRAVQDIPQWSSWYGREFLPRPQTEHPQYIVVNVCDPLTLNKKLRQKFNTSTFSQYMPSSPSPLLFLFLFPTWNAACVVLYRLTSPFERQTSRRVAIADKISLLKLPSYF